MRTVTVTGHGEARVVPDAAVVRVAAAHRAPGVAEALAGADSGANKIAATAREHTAQERIGTTGLQIWRDHDKDGQPAGFVARHSLAIHCDGIAVAGALLTALADEVGDRLEVENVSLEVTDSADAETRAREAAYADAVERASHLARLAGAELGDPQDVVEGGLVGGPVFRGKAAVPVSADASFAPGETTVSSSVTVTFQIR
jgi:uncharacterized protein